jgi:hypothetical protein
VAAGWWGFCAAAATVAVAESAAVTAALMVVVLTAALIRLLQWLLSFPNDLAYFATNISHNILNNVCKI